MILPKTHYELSSEVLRTRLGLDHFMDEIVAVHGNDPSYDDVYASIDPQGVNSELRPERILYIAHVFHHFIHMKLAGEQIYFLMPELAARLAQTEANIDATFLKSPYREIYVQIPQNFFHIRDFDGSLHSIQGFYVYLKEDENGYKLLRIMAAALVPPAPGLPFNDSIFYFRYKFGPGKIQDQIDKQYAEQCKREEELQRYGASRNVEYCDVFAAFVCNVLLYLTSREPDTTVQNPAVPRDLKSARKLQKQAKRLAKESALRVIIVGAKYKESQRVKDIHTAGSVGKWKLQQKSLVPGHWRGQWYVSDKEGTRRREVIWIENYERGPDMAEAVSKPHVVR